MAFNLQGIFALVRNRLLLLPLASLFASPVYAACDVTAWHFGMSPEEVSALTDCGPYRTLGRGDLETYAGVFEGKQANFQFDFDEGKLGRIGINLYEGRNARDAAKVYRSVHDSLSKTYGTVDTPGFVADTSSKAGASAFESAAYATMMQTGRARMAPFAGPADAQVYSTFVHHVVLKKDYYVVILYYERPATP